MYDHPAPGEMMTPSFTSRCYGQRSDCDAGSHRERNDDLRWSDDPFTHVESVPGVTSSIWYLSESHK